jgi:hypothetical protein
LAHAVGPLERHREAPARHVFNHIDNFYYIGIDNGLSIENRVWERFDASARAGGSNQSDFAHVCGSRRHP